MKLILSVLILSIVVGCAEQKLDQKNNPPEKTVPQQILETTQWNHLNLFFRINAVRAWLNKVHNEKLSFLGLEVKNPFVAHDLEADCSIQINPGSSGIKGLWISVMSSIQPQPQKNCPIKARVELSQKSKKNLHRSSYTIPTEVQFKISNSYVAPSIFLEQLHMWGESQMELDRTSSTSGAAEVNEAFKGIAEDRGEISNIKMESKTLLEWNNEMSEQSETIRVWEFTSNKTVTRITEKIVFEANAFPRTQTTLYLNNKPIDKKLLAEIQVSL